MSVYRTAGDQPVQPKEKRELFVLCADDDGVTWGVFPWLRLPELFVRWTILWIFSPIESIRRGVTLRIRYTTDSQAKSMAAQMSPHMQRMTLGD